MTKETFTPPPSEAFDSLQHDPEADLGWRKEGEYYRTAGGARIHGLVEVGDPGAEEYHSATAADPQQIERFKAEIEQKRAALEEIAGYDPNTGEPILRYKGEARRTREIELKGMEYALPRMEAMQWYAAEWRARNVPSAEAKLAAEAEKRERLQAMAEEIAERREAESIAEQILRARRAKS